MTTAPPRPDRRSSLAVLLPAVAVGVVAAALSGAVVAYAVGDPGPVMRWAVILTRIVRDVAATMTIGFALVGGFLTPETTRSSRRAAATRLTCTSAVVWMLATLGSVLSDFADISGLTPNQPSFWTQFFGLSWELPLTRLGIISALVVAAIIVICSTPRGRAGLAWSLVLGWLALLPQALGGHASVSRDHMSAINGLAVHLIAVTTWVGGLAALVALRRALQPHLGVTVARFSAVAGWCYVGLAGSGLLIAWFGLSGWGDLASAYGVLLGIKVAALVGLGVAGWWHRRSMLARLRADAADAAAFVRLAVGELVLMGVAIGAAVALSRTPPPAADRLSPDPTTVYRLTGYPDPGPPASDVWVTAWHTDWLWLALSVVAVFVYARWFARLRRRGDHWPVWQLICWTLGWAVFVYSMCGAPGVYGRILFSWHMIMHMTIAMLVPLLLVPAAPITLALRALPARADKTLGPREVLLAVVHSRYLRVIANPVVAAVIFFFSLATFYFTPLFYYALATHTGHILMTVHFLLSGYLFTWVLVGTDPGPRKWPPLFLLVILFATISFHAFLGVIITSSNVLLAPDFYSQLALPWLPDPLADQHKGGAIAWGVGEAPTLVLALMVTVQWLRQDRRETERLDRQAERDHDAELTAYNERLSHLAARDRGR